MSDLTHLQRALCVDTDKTLCDIASNVLHLLGFETTRSSTVEEALALYSRSGPYDLLTTCMYGIEGDGIELGTAIRKGDSRIAMIIYSGYVPGDLQTKALRAGFDEFLTLPYPLDRFMEAVFNCLRRHNRKDLIGWASHCLSVYELMSAVTKGE